MSYEKLGFVKGQVLKADHLNHMEDGIANAAPKGNFMVYINPEEHEPYAYDSNEFVNKVGQDALLEAYLNNTLVICVGENEYYKAVNAQLFPDSHMTVCYVDIATGVVILRWVHSAEYTPASGEK